MNYDDKEISNKSQMTTFVLLLFLGGIGAHRFYVKKYITGILYILMSIGSAILYLYNFGFAMIVQIAFTMLVILDMIALYSDNFTDGDGKMILSEAKTLVYDSFAERERKLFENKLNKIMLTCLGIGIYVAYFVIRTFVL